jgi:hypothetical protein
MLSSSYTRAPMSRPGIAPRPPQWEAGTLAKSYLKKTASNTHSERLHELATMQYFRRYSSGLLTAVNFAKHKR